jgi:protein-L-isoaspartate(D-aspartate) O-methyltransferase
VALVGLLAGCQQGERTPGNDRAVGETSGGGTVTDADRYRTEEDEFFASLRALMVKTQIQGRGIHESRVLAAMQAVPRHRFLDERDWSIAYDDHPISIGHSQTISQPYIVALMSEQAKVTAGSRVLEVGTGSGYQAAVLAELGAVVYTVELLPELGERAKAILGKLGLAERMHFRVGDGYRGWPEAAPFDAIIVTAAPPHVPEPLYEQLREGGRLIIPVGADDQELLRITKTAVGRRTEHITPVRFVPMRGEAQRR